VKLPLIFAERQNTKTNQILQGKIKFFLFFVNIQMLTFATSRLKALRAHLTKRQAKVNEAKVDEAKVDDSSTPDVYDSYVELNAIIDSQFPEIIIRASLYGDGEIPCSFLLLSERPDDEIKQTKKLITDVFPKALIGMVTSAERPVCQFY
jgi:hypothetical protein